MEAAKRQKVILYSLGAALAIVLGIIVYRRIKNNKGYTDTTATKYNCRNTNSASFPLQKGSNGYQVELLQRINNATCTMAYQVEPDGIWGEKTEQAFLANWDTNRFSQPEYDNYIGYYNEYLTM